MASRLCLQAAAAQGMAAHPDAEMGSVGPFLDALCAWQPVLAPTHNIFMRMRSFLVSAEQISAVPAGLHLSHMNSAS